MNQLGKNRRLSKFEYLSLFIKDKNLIKNEVLENNFVKIYLPSLPEYKWSVNKDIIKKEIMFNQYFIS